MSEHKNLIKAMQHEAAVDKDRETAASYFEKLAKCIREGKQHQVALGWLEIGLDFLKDPRWLSERLQ